jgi:hypothetical protein
MRRKEHMQDIGVRHNARVKRHPADLCMTRRTVAYLLVRRIIYGTTCITAFYVRYAIETLKDGFDAPEAPAAKNGNAGIG